MSQETPKNTLRGALFAVAVINIIALVVAIVAPVASEAWDSYHYWLGVEVVAFGVAGLILLVAKLSRK